MTRPEYPGFMPEHLRYRLCAMCGTTLVGTRDLDGLPRASCPACGWVYYPANVLAVNVVITTPTGVVFLFPPGEPPDAPAALPGGVVEYGETPEEAAVREAREETGLEVVVVRELGRHFLPHTPLGPMLSLIFETRAVGGSLRGSHEGRAAIFPHGRFPAIARAREGSRRALAAYLDAVRDR